MHAPARAVLGGADLQGVEREARGGALGEGQGAELDVLLLLGAQLAGEGVDQGLEVRVHGGAANG
jgi:hypothetical protein